MTHVVKASGFNLFGALTTPGPTSTSSNVRRSKAASDDRSPDYVLLFRTPSKIAPNSETQLEKLLRGLHQVGLEIEVRHGGKGTLLLFVRCPTTKLDAVVRKAR